MISSSTPAAEPELPKRFAPEAIELRWLAYWDEMQLSKADPASPKPPFCLVLPPPNVTGVLHMGHALTVAIQDSIARYKRMRGYEVLWVPGLDHAGIATQTVVERHLLATEGKARTDFSREEFLKRTWEWSEKHQAIILSQIKRLGASCDWSRLCFSLDAPRSRAVETMFKRLFDQSLIYRGDYLVNWDPLAQTALSDDEVEFEEREGQLWTLRYPLVEPTSTCQALHIATTRPETLLGDTALAVAPEDARYRHLIGKNARVPLVDRVIPIIADAAVDPEFGTGVVKITPAHDPLDYQIGQRHGLPSIEVISANGKIVLFRDALHLPYKGLTALEVRSIICDDLAKIGALVDVAPHQHRVGVSYRSKAVIEPRISKQWFFKLSAFKQSLKEAVEKGQIDLIPKSWHPTFYHWIDGLRDWCISRQLWWGHRIPIWHHKEGEVVCWIEEGAPSIARQFPGDWQRDEDVLDTWFSSALWPFSALGWPDSSPLLEKFYPNQLLETGCDILFFWVARMAIFGKLATDQWPFPTCYLHGLIFAKSYWRQLPQGGIRYVSEKERTCFDLGQTVPKDVHSKWEKMSKSKGNALNPIEMIDEYGTDALRIALLMSPSKSGQIDLDRRKFEEFKHFSNKVWNGARFVLHTLQHHDKFTGVDLAQGLMLHHLALEDRWLLGRLQCLCRDVCRHFDVYDLDRAVSESYECFWNEFCSLYIEMAKPILNGKLPGHSLNKLRLLALGLLFFIRLLHPMIPFITEEIFAALKTTLGECPALSDADAWTKEGCAALNAPCCMVSHFPTDHHLPILETDLSSFSRLVRIARALRNVRAELEVAPSEFLVVFIVTSDQTWSTLCEHDHIPKTLAAIERFERIEDRPKFSSAYALVDDAQLFCRVPDELLERESLRIARDLERIDGALQKQCALLNDMDFKKRAPEHVVAKYRALVQSLELQKEQLLRAKYQKNDFQ